MTIRTFEAGDDAAQVSIYNESAQELPKFKPATLDEVRRRLRGPDGDPSSRFFAVADGRPVGYATFQVSGRVSFPWCRKDHEQNAEPLFEAVLQAMRQRGMKRAFAAYRADWPAVGEFFLQHGFQQTREMVNFALDLVDMPTPAARTGNSITPLAPEDVPALIGLGAGLLRETDPAALGLWLFSNPYFPPSSLFALRNRQGQPVAAGITVANPSYAHPRQVDAGMPCFRLGAFGTEGLTHKRLNAVFSLLAGDDRDFHPYALDLLSHAVIRLQDADVETLAAQVPSDAGHLLRFYKHLFRRQGSFPLYERDL
jgi:hypothetical protein